MTDVLSEVLAVTRLKGTVHFSAELRAPWGIALPQRLRSPFYVVTRGQCEITLDGAPSPGTSLGPGDLVVLPGGTAHTLASSATAGAIPLEQFVARFPMDERGHVKALDGKGPTTSLIGGFFELERAPEPLVAILPPMIHLTGDDAEVAGWLDQTLRSIAHEAAQAFPGRAVVLNRLADVLFVGVVRAYLVKMSAAEGTRPPSWLRVPDRSAYCAGLDPDPPRSGAGLDARPACLPRHHVPDGLRSAFPRPRGPDPRQLFGDLADAEGGLPAGDGHAVDRADRRASRLCVRTSVRQGVSSPHRHAAWGVCATTST
jgi:hypothetical protein